MAQKGLMMLALTVGVFLAGWGVLLSPPMETLARSLGIVKPDDIRMSIVDGQVVAEICNADPQLCRNYLARLTFLYHSVFAVLVAMTLYLATGVFSFRNGYVGPIYIIGTAGYLMVITGGIVYGYLLKDAFLHGVFIAGLAFLFTAGLLFSFGVKLRSEKGQIDWLALNVFVSALLLLATSIIGAWIGANEMAGIGEVLRATKMLARIDPDLGEEVFVWRAMTAHQHAMVAALGAAIVFTAFKYLRIESEEKLSKALLAGGLVGQFVMVSACWAVWPYGKIAHLAITPAAIGLIFFTAFLAGLELKKALAGVKGWSQLINVMKHFSIYLLVVWVWPSVAIPGALVAISLRKPIILQPEFRNPIWDWAEVAYNIGHWHVLLLLYAATLFIIYVDVLAGGKLGSFVTLTTMLSTIAASTAINFYMIPSNPAPYIPNPYNDVTLATIVEPSLILLSTSVAVGYIYSLYSMLRQYKLIPG